MTEEYSIGHSEGYQEGWNAAMDSILPAQSSAPLTDEDIEIIDDSMCGDREFAIPFARAIEAAHGIKKSSAA